MDGDAIVYDLGDVAEKPERRVGPPTRVRPTAGTRAAFRSSGAGADREQRWRSRLVGAAVFVPGSSHLLRGELATGLAILCSMGFLATLGWAVIATLERLSVTLAALGLPAHGGVWVLFVIYGVAAVTHVGGVIAAAPERPLRFSGQRLGSVLTAVASLLVPGWGQALTGHRRSAALFLTGCWLFVGSWLLVSAPVRGLLDAHALYLPPVLALLSSPLVRWAGPLLLWVLAVYDAAVRASR